MNPARKYGFYVALPALLFGAVLVATSLAAPGRPALAQDVYTPYLVMYDVTDIVKRVPDFPAPKLGLASSDADGSGTGTILFDFDDDEDDLRPVWGIDELVELIENMIARDSWDTAGIDIIGHKGWIIITQTRDTHMDVANLLRSLERDYRVTSKLVALTDASAAAVGYDVEGDEVQTLKRRKVLRGLKKLHKKGDLTVLRSQKVVMNETQTCSLVLASETSDEKAVIEAERLETSVKRPAKGGGLEISWTTGECDDEEKTTARVKHDEVVVVRTTNHDGTPALLILRPKRVYD